MSLNKNINDDSTLAYLFNKTRKGASDALDKAVSTIDSAIATINATVSTITTNMPKWINVNIGYTAGETIDDKIARLLSGTYLPRGTPFIGVVSSGSKYFTAGYLYTSSSKLYGSFIFSSHGNGVAERGGIYSVNADVVAKRSADMSEVVMKAGDTMSGNLNISRATPRLYLTDTSMDSSLATDTEARSGLFGIRDKNNLFSGYFYSQFLTDGTSRIQMLARRQVGGENSDNYLRLEVANDGTKNVTVTAPAAWRTALGLGSAATISAPISVANGGTGATDAAGARTNLGAVNKAGDTMTGNLTISGTSDAQFTIKNTEVDSSAATVATKRTMTFRGLDKNSKYIGWLQTYIATDGRATTDLGARRIVSGSDATNYISLRVANDGTQTVAVSSAAAWRSALGLGGMATVASPAPIANGGTGQTAVTSTTTASDIATAGGNFSITSASYSYWGKLAMVEVNVKCTTAVTSAGGINAFTMKSGKRPVIACMGWDSLGGRAYLATNGQCLVYRTMSVNATLSIRVTYLLA